MHACLVLPQPPPTLPLLDGAWCRHALNTEPLLIPVVILKSFSGFKGPFKTLTTTGTPLVDELEYRTWSVFGTDTEFETAPGLELSKHLKAGTKRSHRAAEVQSQLRHHWGGGSQFLDRFSRAFIRSITFVRAV